MQIDYGPFSLKSRRSLSLSPLDQPRPAAC
jgi:hypothetical protein